MKRFSRFENENKSFWLKSRYVSETIGYTERRRGSESIVKAYSTDEIRNSFVEYGYAILEEEVEKLAEYSRLRAEAAQAAKSNLMTASEAKSFYDERFQIAKSRGFSWDLLDIDVPMNKQKGTKKDVAFLTALVDIETFFAIQDSGHTADYDPRALLKFTDGDKGLIGSNSRRLDGAVDSVKDPIAVWEIKEYYYTTTFGSRIADGVYESRLDGFELDEISRLSGTRPHHSLFIDSYSVRWEQGKSYLCRLIDMLNEGSVDTIYFGREVTSWESDLRELLQTFDRPHD